MIEFFEQLTVPLLVEALLHTLWVGALSAVLLLCALKWLPARRYHLRYSLALLALSAVCASLPVGLAVLTAPGSHVLTGSHVSPEVDSPLPSDPSVSEAAAEAPLSEEIAAWEAMEVQDLEREERGVWTLYAFAFWVFGSALGMLRVICSVRGALRLRRTAQPVEAVDMAAMCRRFGLNHVVPVLSTALSQVPAVCGLFKPVILLPMSQLTALTPEQIEAILAHELAHIKRYDPIINFVQLMAEAFLFFNLFLWWVSGQVRQEREASCDALAVEMTGRRSTYLQALAEVAAGRITSENMALVSFAGAPGGSLLDRVKRLLSPASSPELRLRVPMLCMLIGGVIAVAVMLQWTAHSAVKALTPKERIERVEAVHAVYPQYELEADGLDESARNSTPIVLSGVVSTPDGRDLGERFSINVYSILGSSSNSVSQNGRKDGTFSVKTKPGRVELLFVAESYAPLSVDLGSLQSDQTGLAYQLAKGFGAQLKFIDPAGQPIPGVELTYYLDLPAGGSHMRAQANTTGIIELSDLGPYPLKLLSSAPGFAERIWDDFRVQPDGVYELVLEPSQPLEFMVKDADTGLPLEGVELRMCARDTDKTFYSIGFTGSALGQTDANGRVVADELAGNALYCFYLSAPGYVGQVTELLASGNTMTVELRRQKPVRIQVSEVSESLLGEKGRLKVVASYEVDYEPHHSSSGLLRETLYADVVDGVAEFVYTPTLEAALELEISEYEFHFSRSELEAADVLDVALSPPSFETEERKAPMRTVELRFLTPEGEPPATGRLRVGYIKGGIVEGRQRTGTYKVVEVAEGVARFEVPVPNDLDVSPEGLKGYWFKEPFRMEVPSVEFAKAEVFEIETLRAGAIAGSVFESNGEPATGLLISVFESESTSDSHHSSRSLNVSVKSSSQDRDRQNDFLASPLPLGASYLICAHRNYTYALSEPIELTEFSPVNRIDLTLPEGRTVHLQVVGTDGKPIALAPTRFVLEPSAGHGFSQSGPRTDRRGQFTLKGINAAIDGQYYVIIDSVPGYLPKKHRIDLSKNEQLVSLTPGLSLRGVVIEADTGKVIPGAEVYAMRAEFDGDAFPSWFDTERSDERGQFEFTNLPEGEFKIASRSGKMATGFEATGRSGADDFVEVKIELYPWEKLTPVEP